MRRGHLRFFSPHLLATFTSDPVNCIYYIYLYTIYPRRLSSDVAVHAPRTLDLYLSYLSAMSMPMPPPEPEPPLTTSPRTQSRDKDSGELAAFKTQGAEDPFLTNAPGCSDQFAPPLDQSMYGNLEMQGDTVHRFAEPARATSNSASPAAIHAPDISRDRDPSARPSTGSHQDWLSPSHHTENENGYSDMSGYTSSDFDDSLFLQPDLGFVNDLGDWTHTEYCDPTALSADTGASDQASQQHRTASVSTSNQLLSPVPTSTPSPPAGGPALHHPAVSTLGNGLTNSPQSLTSTKESRQNDAAQQSVAPQPSPHRNTLNVEDRDHRGHPSSPIVRVSSYTRGDSPSREERSDRQKPPKRGRNDHLSPADDSLSSDSEAEDTPGSRGRARTISVPTSALRTDQGAWLADPNTGQSGLDPASRGDAYVLSPKEMMSRQHLEEKNAEVEQWLSNSEANSDIEENGTRRFKSRVAKKLSVTSRRRARSTGDPSIVGHSGFSSSLKFDDSAIPGPGVLIEERSDHEDEDDEERSTSSGGTPESPPAQVNISFEDNTPTDDYFSPSNRVDSTNEEPLPRQFVRPTPWKDPAKTSGVRDTKYQPYTSNAAIMRFSRRAENIETASRAATWGTRETSEADIESIVGPQGRFNSLHLGRDWRKSRTNSFLEQATKFLPRRSTSSGKRKYTPQNQQQPATESPKRKSNDTADGNSTPSVLSRRKNSFSRPTQHSANSAVMAMTEQIAAIGGGASGVRHTASPSSGSSPLDHLRRRSKSEIPNSHNSGGLMSLMTSVGGPPMPTLASPIPDKKASPSNTSERLPTGDDDDDDDNDNDDMDDDEAMDDKGVVMEFPVSADLIVPSVDGFRTHVRQLNPRLQPALVERIAQEQVRRYKKLVELKTKHANAVSKRTCTAGKRCFDQGGAAAYLPPRASPKDPESTYGQFQVHGTGNPNEGLDDFTEGAVVAALFPSGVPLPPVKRLPAEFECSLCFRVKKFQKPSDWTKHVHEDLQPFTCSFSDCAEPKSFKRKADWVRHESERHRHLEWWTCNMPDCSHTCYRKDNFVQHLVREHKMPDPKVKPVKTRTNKSATEHQASSGNDPDQDELWRRVDECRYVSPKQPKDEACRFCGNVCNSWKKLTVHMAKHMEQVAMPVLELVKQVKVFDDAATERDKMSNSQHQRQLSGDTDLSTPVSAYPSIKPDPSAHSPSSSGISPQIPAYGTSGLPAEALGVPAAAQSSLSSHHLHMQDALAGVPAHSGGQLPAAPPNYTTTNYSQANASSLSPDQIYQNHPHQQQHHLAAGGNSVTYPPPFNAIPRHQGATDTSTCVQPPATTGIQYNLDVNAPVQNVQNTGFDGQQLCASPVDTLGYTYQHAEYDTSGQQIPVHYQPAVVNNNMQFPDGTMAQGNVYLQHGHGPY